MVFMFEKEPNIPVIGLNSDRSGSKLDGLDGILYLEETPFRGERVDAAIVLGTREKHGDSFVKFWIGLLFCVGSLEF